MHKTTTSNSTAAGLQRYFIASNVFSNQRRGNKRKEVEGRVNAAKKKKHRVVKVSKVSQVEDKKKRQKSREFLE